MESHIERISAVECRVRVQIPWKDVEVRLDAKLRDLRRRARIPGFRPGKVPPQMIERMFGKSVRDELAREMVQETFQTAVAHHNARPLTQPVVESSSLENHQPFAYAARFEVPPDLEPKDYTGVPVRRRPTVADESKVDAEVERKRQELTELRPIPEDERDRETASGDVWTIDVDGTIGDAQVSRQDVKVEIGTDEGEFVPGIGAAMAGTKRTEVGTTKTIRFVPPVERMRPEFHGKEAVLSIGLRDIRLKHIPELDDDFARDTGEAETLAELKAKVAEKVLEEDRVQAERDARLRLVQELLERNPFEPAPSMVAREVAAQVDVTKRQVAQQGLTLARLGTSEAQLAQQIRPQAHFNVKAFLLLDAIGKKEGIDVADEELDKELAAMAEESGQNLARMRAQMEKNSQILVLRAQLREEKILDFLMGKAEVTEAPDPGLEEQIEAAAAKAVSKESDAPKSGRRKRRKKDEGGEEAAVDSDPEVSATAAEEPPDKAATPDG